VKRDRMGNFVKMDVLRHFFDLRVHGDLRTTRLNAVRDFCLGKLANVRPGDLLSNVGARISGLIPPGRQAWLARGIVRAAKFRAATYWDDFDVIIDCSREELFRFLDAGRVIYTLNFFRLPKVHLGDGQKADLMPVAGTIGLEEMLQSFPLRPDALAWSIGEKTYVDPCGVLEELSKGVLKLGHYFIENALASDKRYAALKAVFLLARHKMSPDAEISSLINEPLDFTFFDRRNATRLAMELLVHGITPSKLAGYGYAGSWTEKSALGLIANYAFNECRLSE
jgi:hypothetical protein